MGPGTILKRYTEQDAPICEGYNCDCERPATVSIQGETDSFGYEILDFCDECYEKCMADEHRLAEEED